jgi:hypothetical protein
MTTTLIPPKAQIPIGMDVNGQPVMIHPEWLRYLAQSLFTRAGGTSTLSVDDLVAILESDVPSGAASDPRTDELVRDVDDMRHALESIRASQDRLLAALDDLVARLEAGPRIDSALAGRVQQIEDRLQ